MHFLLLFRAIVPGALIQRLVLAFVRMEAACCRAGSPLFKFIQRYVDEFEDAGTFDRMRRFLRERPRAQAVAHLDAWVRMGILSPLRHEVAHRYAGRPGIPPRLLTDVQLSLSPGCDLTCEGCYTASDRGGAAPRRARIAALVDEAWRCGAFMVHIVGKGEPFLSPKWANELLDVIAERPHVYFTIATHGMHIDDALAARLANLGNVLVVVAIDGPPKLHDARRGEGSYDRVRAALARLEAHGAVFGYSCMVSHKSHEALTSEAHVRACADAGCVVGVHSRYFPLTNDAVSDLTLSPSDLATYRARFVDARREAGISLLDLDDLEQHTGCHSRAGESVYIDGITGQVSPCLRVPYAPSDCRLDEGRGLDEILAHPYFVEYRRRGDGCPTWCGANLSAELDAVGALMVAHDPASKRAPVIEAYGERARMPRRLPIVQPTETRV